MIDPVELNLHPAHPQLGTFSAIDEEKGVVYLQDLGSLVSVESGCCGIRSKYFQPEKQSQCALTFVVQFTDNGVNGLLYG